ncbi:MAG: hypothetical protein H5U22_06325 [Rhizobium sp.]|nr:hypothetical protein [Rhizobium sp.]
MMTLILMAAWRLVHMASTLLVVMVVASVLSGSDELFFVLADDWWVSLICGGAYAAFRFTRDMEAV